MYAVIKTGGKQYRVEPGATLHVERLGADEGAEISLIPVLVIDGDTVLATPEQLDGAEVTGRVVGQAKGPKITGFTYRHKTRHRRRWGHRQGFDVLEITGITAGGTAVTSDVEDEPETESEQEPATEVAEAPETEASEAEAAEAAETEPATEEE
jgi:large subunit ribosomal protein L21